MAREVATEKSLCWQVFHRKRVHKLNFLNLVFDSLGSRSGARWFWLPEKVYVPVPQSTSTQPGMFGSEFFRVKGRVLARDGDFQNLGKKWSPTMASRLSSLVPTLTSGHTPKSLCAQGLCAFLAP